MSEGWNIAILGATGAVGEALLETLADRQFPVGIFMPLRVATAPVNICVLRASRFSFRMRGVRLDPGPAGIFAAGVEATAAYVEEATNAGCPVIDLSGLFALEPDVPLVVPDVNPFVLADYRNRNVIAVANSLTSQLLSALKPLIDQGGLSRISVTSLLSASAHGKKRLMRWRARALNYSMVCQSMTMISSAASWRSICCRCCPIVKEACAKSDVSSMKPARYCRMTV